MTTAYFDNAQNPAQHPAQHPGVARVELAVQSARGLIRQFDGTRSLATFLLAAIVSAMLVVADQVIDSWTEGHLLAAWVLLWTVGFAALGLFAGTARSLAQSTVATLRVFALRQAQRRADERLWAVAQTDARIMAEIVRAQADAVPMLSSGAEVAASGYSNITMVAAQVRRQRMLANRNDF